MEEAVFWAILVGMSLVPPLLLALWVRRLERFDREPLPAVLKAFGYGATVGVAVAYVLNTLFGTAATHFAAGTGLTAGALTAILVAPFVEELTKGMGVATQKRHITEPEDGLVYGAALGLGFAATENLLYGVTAFLDGGADAAVTTLILRIFSSTILHAGASAMFAYGFGLVVLGIRSWPTILEAYLAAAVLHSVYNILAVSQGLLALLLALVLVWAVFGRVRRRIEELDSHGG